MSTIGDLLFGSGPTPQVSSSSSSTSMPAWMQTWYNQLLTKGSQVANAPYTANPNQQVAPLTADQTQAYSNVEGMQGAEQPLLNTASSFAQSAGSPIDAAQINNYLNPYTQNVVDSIGSLAGRNLSENLLPAVNDTFTRSGQFGSRGNFDLTGRAIRDSNESALNAQSQALQSGYNTALSAAQQDQSNKLNAAGTLGSLATTGQNIGLQGAAALEAAGQSQQAQGQKNLDVLNQQWQTQQDYPKNQVSWLNTLFNPSGAGSTTTTSNSTTPSTNNPSPLSGIVGAVGSIGSLLGSLFAEGGAVRMADGGAVSSRYDTELSPDDEAQFQKWKAINAPHDSGGDYDLRGAFLAGVSPAANGHWPDTFKKPNEPTFSDESQYAVDAPEEAGHWDGNNFIPPRSPRMDRLPSEQGATIGSMGPDPASIARGNAEIVRRAQVALSKDPAQRDGRDNHALQAYQMLMKQQDSDAVSPPAAPVSMDAFRAAAKRTMAPAPDGYRRGGSIGGMARAA